VISPAGPVATPQMAHRHIMRSPALVSPSTQHATQAAAIASPRTPQSVTSSSPGIIHAAPVASNAAAVAATTAAAASANIMTTKPPRPYTEYTMFYQMEREFILHRILTTKEEQQVQGPDAAAAVATTNNQTALFQNDPLMPARYRSLPLRADWYISGKSKKPTKRKHRKSHGKIGFLELTRMIAARWAKVDDETRKYCKMMAAMELVKYKEDMESYNLYKDRLSAIGEIPEDMKERLIKKQRAQERKEANKRSKEDGVTISSSDARKKRSAPVIKADIVSSAIASAVTSMAQRSRAPTRASTIKLEPIAHDSPSNLDNDMEQFISALVHNPNQPPALKVITPERSPKKRRIFRDKPAVTAAPSQSIAAATSNNYTSSVDEIIVPLKVGDDDDHIDGIKMAFSGIDEAEIAREFSQHVHRGDTSGRTNTGMAMAAAVAMKAQEPSFDYWDALVESPGL